MDNNGAAPNDTKTESIEQKLEQLAPLSDSCSIYRVPERLRCLYPNIYTPKVVSIGPLHHGKKTLQDMEEHKYRYLKRFLDRTQKNLQFFIQEVSSQEAKLRSSYAENIKFSSDEFVTIILVDSAFIIELFLNDYIHRGDIAQPADRIFRPPYMIFDIILDLLVLENQVPFFILENLYDLNPVGHPDNEDRKYSFIHLFRTFFDDITKDIGVNYDLQKVSCCQVEGKHFIDIVRNLCLPSEPLVGGRLKFNAPSITELHRAGVKLRVLSTRNLLSIRFNNGILEIPKLAIDDTLEPTLRNVVAFEQCHYADYNPITDYLALLDCFMNTPNDMEVLVKLKIVTNDLGDSSEACALINSLCKGIMLNSGCFCFATLCEDLHNHCNRPWNHWKASLRQNYLNSPWAIVSVVAAAFLIILTIIQTVCSLISL